MDEHIYFSYFGSWDCFIGITYESSEILLPTHYNYEEDNVYSYIYIYIYNALFQYILNAKKNIGIGKNGRYVIINNIKNDPFAKIERNNLHGKYLNDTINEEIYASKISKLVIKNDVTFGNFEYENPILAALNHSTTIIADECSMKGEVLLYYIIY